MLAEPESAHKYLKAYINTAFKLVSSYFESLVRSPPLYPGTCARRIVCTYMYVAGFPLQVERAVAKCGDRLGGRTRWWWWWWVTGRDARPSGCLLFKANMQIRGCVQIMVAVFMVYSFIGRNKINVCSIWLILLLCAQNDNIILETRLEVFRWRMQAN